MADEQHEQDKPRRIEAGNISGVSGDVNIAGGNIYTGYTVAQVSVLLAQIRSEFQPKPFDGRCPYKGLDVFEEEDTELFFGRERLVDDLVNRVKASRTVFVTGPSGSGKSSLARAGLIPALKQGAIKSSERWLYETMKPGREPMAELARVASSFAGTLNAGEDIRTKGLSDPTVLSQWCEIALKDGRDKRAVLFIDQFEEVFTQISREEERLAFINLVAHAATSENGRVIVLFSMRSDFISNCATYPQLNALLNQQFVQIGAMQPDELVSAIAQPALRVGLRIDPDLIAQIIRDTQGEPGALPLMQFALKDLFDAEQAKGGVIALTREAYLQPGRGIGEALERHADDSLAGLNENEQELARSVFSGLIEIGRGTQDTKRTAFFSELVPANTSAEEVNIVIQKLEDARLITTDEQDGNKYTIAHEKLIDAWPWLKKLVNENRDAIALQNEIASDAKEWDDHERDSSYLYSGARLANADEQLKAKKLALSGPASEYIRAGQARKRRGQIVLIGSISIVFALLVGAVVIFANLTREANNQARIARAGELAAQSGSNRDRNFPLSLLLGVESYRTHETLQGRGALLDSAVSRPRLREYLFGHTSEVYSVAFSPDGETFASGSADSTIILWDVGTGKPIGQPLRGHTDSVYSVAFSPDGETLASGSRDNTVILWDVRTGKPIGQPLRGHTAAVESVAFSPDGKTLASGSLDDTIILWDVGTGKPIGEPLKGHTNNVYSVAFSPDGETLASGSHDNTIILWDVGTGNPIGEPLKGHTAEVFSVAFSPDGETLASGSDDSTIILWDVGTGNPIGEPLKGHTDGVLSVAFSPDGETLASGSWDETIILWDVSSVLNTGVGTGNRIGQPLKGHTDYVTSVAFSPDTPSGTGAETLASGSGDNTIILWDVGTGNPIGQPLTGHTDDVESVAFSPDGETLASGSYDKTIILWDVGTGKPIGQPLTGHTAPVSSVAFSPDGETLASGSADSTIILWDVRTGKPIGQPLRGHADSVYSVAFSPDGETLASGSRDNTVILWDVGTGKPTGQPLRGHTDTVYSVAFSPDGETLASGSNDDSVILWDVGTGKPIGQPLRGHSTAAVESVAFSLDGTTLASGSGDNTVILWDVATRQPIGGPLTEHTGFVTSVAFSPDGETLASGSGDDTIILWDVGTGNPIGEPLRGHTDAVYSVAFSPDGKTLASGSWDSTVILWDLSPESWADIACQRVRRNFTLAEWEQYLPTETYRKTCEQWPLALEGTPTPGATP